MNNYRKGCRLPVESKRGQKVGMTDQSEAFLHGPTSSDSRDLIFSVMQAVFLAFVAEEFENVRVGQDHSSTNRPKSL